MKIRRDLVRVLLFCAAMLPSGVQAQFAFVTNNGAITITGYSGSGGAVVIPDTTNGLPVTSIGNGAFYQCTNLTSVDIPDSITNLGIYTFYARSNLASATISTNVTSIGVSAFDSCAGLTNVTIPGGVTNIGSSAFQNCAGLTGVTIPASVASIGRYALDSCGSLTAIMVDPQNTNYSSVDGILIQNFSVSTNLAHIYSNTVLFQCPAARGGNYTVPTNVNNIGDFAFDSCASLTSVVISTNLVCIGDWAFSGCSGLTNLTIPNTVTMIGNYAFESCTSLTSVVIPDNVTNIGFHAFDGCTSLTDATIGSGLTYYPWYQIWLATIFSDCPNLTSIYLRGPAPFFAWNPTNAVATPTTYYLPGANPSSVSGIPTALWLPQIQNSDVNFGFQANQFGFDISWTSGTVVEVDACTNLANPVWTLVGDYYLYGDSIYFSDSQWTNYPARFYRVGGFVSPQ